MIAAICLIALILTYMILSSIRSTKPLGYGQLLDYRRMSIGHSIKLHAGTTSATAFGAELNRGNVIMMNGKADKLLLLHITGSSKHIDPNDMWDLSYQIITRPSEDLLKRVEAKIGGRLFVPSDKIT